VPDDPKSLFADRLRELRTEAGLTQAELAVRAGLHPQAVVKLEAGEHQPTWATVTALADALGLSCQAFRVPPSRPVERPKGRPKRQPSTPPPHPENSRGA